MEFAQAFDPVRSLKSAWKLFKQTPLTVLIGGLLIGVLESNAGGGGGDAADESSAELESWMYLVIPVIVCLVLGLFALTSWLEIGFARAVEFGLRTGRDELGRVFKGRDRLGTMLLARFLCALLFFASFVPLVILFVAIAHPESSGWTGVQIVAALITAFVFVYVWLGLFLVNAIVAFESCTATESIGFSWRMASGQRWQLFWFCVAQILLTIAGVLACCVGLVVALPLTQVMRFEAYVALTQGEQYPHWWIGSGRLAVDERPVPPAVPPLAPRS
jgi:hypothetical protein